MNANVYIENTRGLVGMGQQSAVKPMGDIEQAFCSLEKSIECLGQTVATLQDRTQPICSPANPEKDCESRPQSSVPIAARINKSEEVINRLQSIIASINSRIAI